MLAVGLQRLKLRLRWKVETQKAGTPALKVKVASPTMITRQKEPKNLETPFGQVDSFLTPNEVFYIRSHLPEPELDIDSYRLSIGGAVSEAYSLTYQELVALPSVVQVATLECAGNSRVFLTPQVEGAQWELGAVGNAEWTGVPLSLLLEKAGLASDACEIVLEGADRGMAKEKPFHLAQFHTRAAFRAKRRFAKKSSLPTG